MLGLLWRGKLRTALDHRDIFVAKGKMQQPQVTILDSAPRSSDWGTVLVGRVVTEKKVSWGTVTGVLRWSWSDFGEVRMSLLGENLFFFEFQDRAMADRVLAEGPWAIDGFCLNLKPWKPDQRLEEIDLESMSVWVQIHGLTLDQMVENNARLLGQQIGRVIDTGKNEKDGIVRGFLRVRVDLNISEPLVQGTWVQSRGGSRIWVEFKYERLPSLCFKCGRIDHVEKACKYEHVEDGDRGYGAWLKASGNKIRGVTFNEGIGAQNWKRPASSDSKDKGSQGGRDRSSTVGTDYVFHSEQGGPGLSGLCKEATSGAKGSLDFLEEVRIETKDGDSPTRAGNRQVERGWGLDKENELDQERCSLDNKKDTHKDTYNPNPELSTEGGPGQVPYEEKQYFVEIPSDGEQVVDDRAIVPFNLACAMRDLSLKRKAELEEGVCRKRVKSEKGQNISRGVDRSVKGKSHTSRPVQKRQRNRRPRSSRNTEPLFDVVITDIAEFQSGCGGWPQSATQEP